MTLSLSSFANLAAKMRMPATSAVALPTVIEVFAKKSGMSETAMFSELLENEPLRDYAAQMCIQAEASL